MKPNLVQLGTLLLNGQPASIDAECRGEKISFGDSGLGEPIPFLDTGTSLVSLRVLCLGIKWSELHAGGFISGRPIKIDGAPYRCRSLKVGVMESVCNEWDTLLDEYGENDSLLEWNTRAFWGQEGSKSNNLLKMVRGGPTPRAWQACSARSRYYIVGFRPVLEPLSPAPEISKPLIGRELAVYGPTGYIQGVLLDITDYDLILDLKSGCKTDPQWGWMTIMKRRVATVDRSAIVWMREIEND